MQATKAESKGLSPVLRHDFLNGEVFDYCITFPDIISSTPISKEEKKEKKG